MRILKLAAAACLALSMACGSSNPTGPGNPTLTNGTFTATVNGSSFSAISATVVATGQITSIGTANAAGQGLGFAWIEGGVGTYTFSATNPANANFSQGGATWTAGASGGSGTITITTRTANRVAGSFSFQLNPVTNSGATGNRTVSGNFDLTY